MIIFQPAQTLMQTFGFLFTYSDKLWYRWYNYVVYTYSTMLFVPLSAFLVAHSSDLAIVAESLSLSSGQINSMVKGIVLILNRDKIIRLINDLQRNVNNKEKLGRVKHYVAMNIEINFWTRVYATPLVGALVLLGFGPLLDIITHYSNGDLTKEMLRMPIAVQFPYDAYQSPVYEISYLLTFVAMSLSGLIVVLGDCLFMGVCSQLIACQKDLQDMIHEMVDDSKFELYVNTNESSAGVDRRLIRCIEFHNKILSHVNIWKDVMSPIIFTQFVVSTMQMVTLAFQIQLADNIAVDRQVANVVTGLFIVTTLFPLCYYGSEITFQGIKVAEAAYTSSWYKCSPRQRRYICMIIVRAHYPETFRGFRLVKCTMSSYTAFLNTVGSLVTLLRTIS